MSVSVNKTKMHSKYRNTDKYVSLFHELLPYLTEKVVSQLNTTLLSKSDLYGDVAVRSVFRLNNNHYVLKALQRSGLSELVQLTEVDCQQLYHDMIQQHKKDYTQRYIGGII